MKDRSRMYILHLYPTLTQICPSSRVENAHVTATRGEPTMSLKPHGETVDISLSGAEPHSEVH